MITRQEAIAKRLEELERAKKQKLLDSFTPLDYKILELRKKGASWYAICKELNVGVMYARYKLQVMLTIPELAQDWDKKQQPMTREEWKQFHRDKRR